MKEATLVIDTLKECISEINLWHGDLINLSKYLGSLHYDGTDSPILSFVEL